MLVVSHDDHIIRHNALLLPVILLVVVLRDIVVHGEHDVVLPALHGQLPDELDVVLAALLRYHLKVHIDAVDPGLEHSRHQLVDEICPAGGAGEQRVGLLLGADAPVEIPDSRPHLDVGLMGIVHILRAGDGLQVPGRVGHVEPGGGYGSQPLGAGDHLQDAAVGVGVGHIVPCHVDHVVF